MRAIAMLDRIPAVAGQRGRPRMRPDVYQGDAAYGTAFNIRETERRGIQPLLAAHGKSHCTSGSGLGKTRYVAERTLAWFGNFRRIKLCYERTAAHLQAFHEIAAALICFKKLTLLTNQF
jgi:transposase